MMVIPVMWIVMVVVVMSNGERREEIQLRIKIRTITIFWERRGGDVVTLVLMLAVVVIVGVVFDFVVVVNDDDISVICFRITATTILCRTVFNATLPHPYNYIPPVPLNPTNSTLIDISALLYQSHSTTPRFALLHPFHTTPAHIALPRPIHTTPTEMYKQTNNTNENKN